MDKETEKHHIDELKEMIKEKEEEEPVEKVLTKFCARHGVSMDTCRIYYKQIVEEEEITEE